jgi:hypothetical protein
MRLSEYFEETKGIGILSTADKKGRVNAAIYARPHFMDDGSITFIMADRLSHENLQANAHASYLFIEEGKRSFGKRLYLKKIKEEQNSELIDSLRRKRRYEDREYTDKKRFLVYFTIEKVLPLIGDAEESPVA